MTTLWWTKRLPSLIVILELSTVLFDGPLVQANEINVLPFENDCQDYNVGDSDIVFVTKRHPVTKTLDCKFVMTSTTGYLEYLIHDANFYMCGVALSIYDGPQRSSESQKFHVDCKTPARLPITGRTISNELTIHVQISVIVELSFNMSIVNNKGSAYLPKLKNALKKEYDICNPDTLVHHPAVFYLPKPGYHSELYVKGGQESSKSEKCLLVVKTCMECQIGVEVLEPQFDTSSCSRSMGSYSDSSRCPSFTFYDGDYKAQTLRTIQTSHLSDYSSQSKHLYVEASINFPDTALTGSDGVIARFRVFSKMKYKVISRNETAMTTFRLTSPFFPNNCIQNGEKYTIVINNVWDEYFVMIFDDWLLPHNAEIKFPHDPRFNTIGWVRRPVVYSDRRRVEMTFYTGIYNRPGTYFSHPGFKASVSFRNGSKNIPVTDCDMEVDDVGGLIQIDSKKSYGLYRDCIWLVKKRTQASGLLLNQNFKRYIDPWINVEIREGLVSTGRQLFLLPNPLQHDLATPLITNEKGFYIRITGRLFHRDVLVFHYAAFTYDCELRMAGKFQCKNQRCIDKALRCDGLDHCGDGSDESEMTCRTGSTDGDNRTSSQTTVGIVPLGVSLVVVLFFCVFLVALHRCYRLRLQRLPASRRAAPSSTSTSRRDHRRRRQRAQSLQMSVTVTSGELPPSYNEVMMSAPLSNVNVAFSFSPGDEDAAFTSPPPSYGEAIQAADFDLSRSNSREEAIQSSLGCGDTSVVDSTQGQVAETSFTALNARQLPYNPSTRTTEISRGADVMAHSRDPRSNRLPTANANSLVTTFDPNSYVSSSSSTDFYDEDDLDDDGFVRRNFHPDRRYMFDSSSTTDDEDDNVGNNGNNLYTQALSLVSLDSSTPSLRESATPILATSASSRTKTRSANNKAGSGGRCRNENVKAMKKNRKRRKNENEVVTDSRRENSDDDDRWVEGGSERGNRGGHVNRCMENEDLLRDGREGLRECIDECDESETGNYQGRKERRRHGSPGPERAKSSNGPPSTYSSSCNERRVFERNVDKDEGSGHRNRRPVNISSDRLSEDQGSRGPSESTRRYEWTRGPRHRPGNRGADERRSGNPTPLTVTNYMVTQDGETSRPSPVPLAQVLFKTENEDQASFV